MKRILQEKLFRLVKNEILKTERQNGLLKLENAKTKGQKHVSMKENQIPRPPPIMVKYNKMKVENSDNYRTTTKSLNTEKALWYSFENKQCRKITVVVKNLHHS